MVPMLAVAAVSDRPMVPMSTTTSEPGGRGTRTSSKTVVKHAKKDSRDRSRSTSDTVVGKVEVIGTLIRKSKTGCKARVMTVV